MLIKRLPRILALHLKRFKFMEHIQRHRKLSYRVPFPMEIRLPNTVNLPPRFLSNRNSPMNCTKAINRNEGQTLNFECFPYKSVLIYEIVVYL